MKLSENKKRFIFFLIAFSIITGLIVFRQFIFAQLDIHCEICIEFTAFPTAIPAGNSSTLTLKVDNTPDSFAICSITQGVISNESLNDGNYNYVVSPIITTTYNVTCTGGGGTVSDTVTITITNNAPTATDLTVTEGNYCGSALYVFLSWQFSDSDPGDTQGAYQVQVDNNSDFSSLEVDSGKVYSSSEIYTASGLSYKTTYYWRLKVWDDKDLQSSWIYGPSFTTPQHIYPDPDFTWSPSPPSVDEIVQFCAVQEVGVCSENVSTCYDINNNPISCSGKTFLWTLPLGVELVGTSTTNTTENPQMKFSSSDSYNIKLEITDDVGTCGKTQQVGVTFPLPEWEESAP